MRSSSFGFVVIIMIGLSTLNLPLDMNVVDKGGGGGVNGDCGREESASDSGWDFHRVTKSVCG